MSSRQTHSWGYLVLAGLALTLAGGNGRAIADPVSDAPPPPPSAYTRMDPELMAFYDTLQNGGFTPLVIDAEIDPMWQALADDLQRGDVERIRGLTWDGAKRGLQQALTQYQKAEGVPAANSLMDIAPYLFTWSAAVGSTSIPATVVDAALLQPTSHERPFASPENPLQLAVDVGPDGMQFRIPDVEQPLWIKGHPESIPTASERASRQPVDVALLEPFLQEMQARKPLTDQQIAKKTWNMLNTHLAEKALPADARYVAAQDQLRGLLHDATSHLLGMPKSFEQACEASGRIPLNLVPADPADADLVIGCDGVQAFRITTRFPSGTKLDSVWYWKLIGTRRSMSQLYAYSEFEHEVGRPFTTWAAFNLVPADQAAIPGL